MSVPGCTPPEPRILAFGFGLRRRRGETTLDVSYPMITYRGMDEEAERYMELCGHDKNTSGFAPVSPALLHKLGEDLASQPEGSPAASEGRFFRQLLEYGVPPQGYSQLDYGFFFLLNGRSGVQSAEEAYFKLHLISQRMVKPHEVSLDGQFGVLQNIAWTNKGPILPEDLANERVRGLLTGEPLIVSHVDKFPYLVNYHVPSGVRIAAGSQVRLGAYLGDGTTVMPAGYVNFNAGTAGKAMVEGRISAGVFVGDSSDIGGGASIMGTLSGGNKHVISIGSECLLGANAGTGISLGDGCTIAAGLYVTAGTKVALYGRTGEPVSLAGDPVAAGENLVKAIELDGRSHLLFYQDSATGQVIAKPNPRTIELNDQLHKHN